MNVTLYNTETKAKEVLTPLKKDVVTIYTCGPTVYDYAHIGNLRSYVFVDILKRTLLFNDYTVKNTINLTDFGHLTDDGDHGEDKIMKGLQRDGLEISLEAMRKLTDIYIDAFKNDVNSLRILPPTTWSRASDFVKEQILLAKTLDEKGYLYETKDSLYFSIEKFPRYGRLGNIQLDKLRSGARLEVDPEKKHPADFAVWKKSPLGWASPWGKGFPGWHIECSAMAIATLGKQIDIHTGGIDHVHTHHNAEIAQSEAATGKTFANIWMHNEFVTVDGEKIAKSAGTGITLRTLTEAGYNPDSYRYWLLTAHYRSHCNFSYEALDNAQTALQKLKRLVYVDLKDAFGPVDTYTLDEFRYAINNDLDTPKALAILWGLAKNTDIAPGTKLSTIAQMDKVLGIGLTDSKTEFIDTIGLVSISDLPEHLKKRLDDRMLARENKDWLTSDAIRDEFLAEGYIVKDTSDGVEIFKK